MADDGEADSEAPNEVLWEEHARWWQRTFTDGVDPEYEALILPMVSRHLAGRAAFSISAAVRVRWPAASPGWVRRSSGSIPPRPR